MRKKIRQVMVFLAALCTLGMAVPEPAYAAEKEESAEGRLADGGGQQIRETGSFRLVLSEEGDKDRRLAGGRFAVYEKAGGKKAGELVTDKDGRAGMELAEGDYILKESAAPEGYLLSEETLDVSIQKGESWTLGFVNRKEDGAGKGKEDAPGRKEEKAGLLQIINAGEGTGDRLSGGMFYVYGSSGVKVEEAAVSRGKAELSLPEGDYYLKEMKAPEGYLVESARIWFRIREGAVTVAEITSERDRDFLTGKNPQELIPKTGERFPVLRYILAADCFGVSLWCCLCLRQRKEGRDLH